MILLNSGIDWSKPWPQVPARDKAMVYEAVRNISSAYPTLYPHCCRPVKVPLIWHVSRVTGQHQRLRPDMLAIFGPMHGGTRSWPQTLTTLISRPTQQKGVRMHHGARAPVLFRIDLGQTAITVRGGTTAHREQVLPHCRTSTLQMTRRQ